MFDRSPHLLRAYSYRIAILLTVFTSLFAENFYAFNPNFFDPPPNDDFVNAQPILGSSGVIEGTNVGATKEVNEPNHAGFEAIASVWYRWQAPSNGTYNFTTFGSEPDTVLAVYTGSS